MIVPMVNFLIIAILAVISPWMIRNIYNGFVRSIPEKSMPLPSNFILMIVIILLELTKYLGYYLPIMPNLAVYFDVSFFAGLLPSIILVCLNIMMIGVPCAYLDTLVKDTTTTIGGLGPEEDEIRKVVQYYRIFQTLSGPYLFLIYSCSSCLLINNFYVAGIQQVCSLIEQVSITISEFHYPSSHVQKVRLFEI